ncbi:restriction endonuclease subunit S [Marinigracilibium pacificum]|uniref:Type I restriction modification DNA specificity domain-containing protein n=1 Tax=Marinigracilibium pacificum TaxID=2729599 RepID=A0A848J8D6_9BACT|nr:restriction endonuclease subunit S [Marinigracilibium pacificum]NMM50750.1 hypothetical protein [Marinigracilibium pacificum]
MRSEIHLVNLDKVLTFSNGKTSPKRDDNYQFNVFGSNGIIGKTNKINCPANSIVIGRVGSYCGSVYFSNSECWVTDNAIKAVVKEENSAKYLYYKLISFNLNKLQIGTGQPLLNQSILKSIETKIHPLHEQKAIAHILGTLDDKIELNWKMNQTLEEMAQALFKSWFVDFDPVLDKALAAGNPIPEPLQQKAEKRLALGDKRKPLPKHIQELFPDSFTFTEELGWIPEGWEVKNLDTISIELRRGISPKYIEEGGTRVINQKCIRNHEINFDLTRRNDPNKKKIDGRTIEFGDILINSTGVGTLGRMAAVGPINEEIVVDSHVTLIRPDQNQIKIGYFISLMYSMERYIESIGEGSTGQTELSRSRLKELQILHPNNQLQKIYDSIFQKSFKKKYHNQILSKSLESIRDTLLPKLISGELRVPDAEKIVADHV